VNGTVNATTFVGNLNGNATTATTATYAQSLISGGSLIPGINTPGSIIINSNSNKTYASARLYVDGNTIVSGDVTLRSDGAGTVIIGSNNATTSMSLNGDLSITGRIYTYFYYDYAGNTAPRIQTVNGGGTYFNTISTNENAFTFLYGSTAANLSSDTTNRVAVIDSNGSLRIGLKTPTTTNIFDGWGGPRLQWGTQYGDTRMIAPDAGLDSGGACVFYTGGRERINISANGVISLKANVTADYAINCASLSVTGQISATGDITATANLTASGEIKANKGWSISQLGVQLYTGTFTWSPSQSGGIGLTTTVIKSGTLPTLAAGNYYVEADVTAYPSGGRSAVDRFYVYFCSDTGGTTPIGMPAIFSLRDEYVSIIGNTSVYPVPTCRANTNLNGGSGYSIIITNQFGINGPTDDQWVVTVNARAISCGF